MWYHWVVLCLTADHEHIPAAEVGKWSSTHRMQERRYILCDAGINSLWNGKKFVFLTTGEVSKGEISTSLFVLTPPLMRFNILKFYTDLVWPWTAQTESIPDSQESSSHLLNRCTPCCFISLEHSTALQYAKMLYIVMKWYTLLSEPNGREGESALKAPALIFTPRLVEVKTGKDWIEWSVNEKVRKRRIPSQIGKCAVTSYCWREMVAQKGSGFSIPAQAGSCRLLSAEKHLPPQRVSVVQMEQHRWEQSWTTQSLRSSPVLFQK